MGLVLITWTGKDIFAVLRRFPFCIPKQIQLLWFKVLFWMGPATSSIGPECHCSRECCMAPVVGMKPWIVLHQKQKLLAGFSAMLAGFCNQYATTHGAAPTMCKALCLVLWGCKERLQLFIIPREEYSLLLKRSYFAMQTDVPGWSVLGGSDGEKTGKMPHRVGGPERTSQTRGWLNS